MTRAQPAPRRIVVFTDVNGPVSATLLAETLRLSRQDRRFEVAAVVVSDPADFEVSRRRRVLRLGRRVASALLNNDVPLAGVREPTLDLARVERRWGVPVLIPEGGDPNEPGFVRRLALALRPDVALSLYCLRIFRRPLLELFEQCVNYHDSLLPVHRGVLATSFSLYTGDPVSGFTFHRMDESLDGGPILVQGGVVVGERDGILAVKRRKLAAAAAALPDVLRMIDDAAPGRPQGRGGSYHSRRDALALLHVARPEDIASDELARRLRAFGMLEAGLDGALQPVTAIRPGLPGDRLAFTAADGRLLRAHRLSGLPPALYRATNVLDRPITARPRVVAPAPASVDVRRAE